MNFNFKGVATLTFWSGLIVVASNFNAVAGGFLFGLMWIFCAKNKYQPWGAR